MSYKVLARKWRPQHFQDMLGQEAVLRALVNALDSDRLHHAYLFTGMRGVGKTTIARIFAKCLNCIPNGVSSSPCGECSACKDIEAGRFLDLIEVDAASRTKVDETRELLENVPYAPASGRYKVYLIDEVHMFSSHSFNALLKTLEEPPEHVKFLLATTDPQKVPLTVLSRCLQFNLRRMPTARLADYLATILDAEKVPHERPALELVAAAAEGSVRDSLSLVEQATAFGEGSVREVDVESMLGRVSTDRLLGLLDALGDSNPAVVFNRVDELAEYAPDFAQLLGELLSLMHRIAMQQNVPGSESDEASGHERVVELAHALAPDELQLWYQIGLHARRDMPFSPDPREAFDMALLRMRAFSPQAPGTSRGPEASRSLDGAFTAAATVTAPGTVAAPTTVAAAAAVETTTDPAAPVDTSMPESEKSESGSDPAPRSTEGRGSDPRAALMAVVRGEAAPDAPPDAPPDALPVATPDALHDALPDAPPDALHDVAAGVAHVHAKPSTTDETAALSVAGWPAVIDAIAVSGMPRQLASHCAFVAFENDKVVLQLEAGSEHLNSERFQERVRAGIIAWSGHEIALEIRLVDEPLATPARLDAKREQDALASARRSIDSDPLARALADSIDGKLDPASVRPIDATS